MRRILLCIIAFGWLVPVRAQQTSGEVRRFTLEECLSYALGNNYDRQSMHLSEKATEVTYDQSKQERLPDVSASASESLSSNKLESSTWSGSYGVSAGMTIYQGGSISNTIRQNKMRVEQSAYKTAQYDNALTIKILQAFLSVLGNEELLKYQQSLAEASAEQVKQGQAQLRLGTILESDFLLLESQYANDLNNISDSRITRDNSLLSLKSLLSMHPAEPLEIIYPDSSAVASMRALPGIDTVLEHAATSMPEFRINQFDVDIAGIDVALAKSGYMPSLSLSGGASSGHSPDFNNFGTQLSDGINERIGLTLSVPIYNNGRTRSLVARSKIAEQQAELNRKQTELNIIQTVSTDYNNVVSAYNSFKTTDIRQHAYLKTFEAYRAQFDAGSITAVDLLQQQNNYIGALNQYIQSKYGFMLKRKILDVYMGVPVKM